MSCSKPSTTSPARRRSESPFGLKPTAHGKMARRSDKYYRENQWWVSPYNYAPEVRAKFDLPAKVSIHDATLRDGEQTPGVVMTIADKIAIAEKLDEIGVDRIEAGMSAVSAMDFA